LRQFGIHNGALKNGFKVDINDNVDFKQLRRKVNLEKSEITDMMLILKKALTAEDFEAISRLEKELKQKSEELNAITETMADTFALTAMKTFIGKLPDTRISAKKREFYYESLCAGINREGILAKTFLDIWLRDALRPWKRRELAKRGLVYRRMISREIHQDPIRVKLMEMGYNPMDPLCAYDDMKELRRRARERGVALKELLFPVNLSTASVGKTYCLHIPLFTEVIEKYGMKKAFKKLLKAQSMAEIEQMIK
jgi:hypothetical protein